MRVSLEKLCGAPMDRELRLQLPYPLLRGSQLGVFIRGHAGLKARIDAGLAPPDVYRLFADAEVSRDLGNLLPALHELDHSSSKLCRVAPSCHIVLRARS